MDNSLKRKIEKLTMKPADWSKLSAEVDGNEYSKIVNDYNKRYEESKPTYVCNTLFGTCRYCGFGFKCGYKGACNHKHLKVLVNIF